jgi:hypothetical protein
MKRTEGNLLNLVDCMNRARRCSAKSKRSGQPCKAPAMRSKHVCRCHGAMGGAPKGQANGAWRHGHYAGDAVAQRRAFSQLMREAKDTIDDLD